MSNDQSGATGPDLTLGVPSDTMADGKMLLGHVGEDPVLLARRGNTFFAIGATCTHYGGPLAEGLMVEDTVRCPWHHACFSLKTGEALHAPALSPSPAGRPSSSTARSSCAGKRHSHRLPVLRRVPGRRRGS